MKTTIPELLLIGWAFVMIGRRALRRHVPDPDAFRLYDIVPLVLLVGWYWIFAIASHLNIGYRHMLPAVVGEIILVGALGRTLSRAIQPEPSTPA